MPVDRLLSELLSRNPEPEPDAAVLYECRHCGSKFDEPVGRCPVCETAEIASYEFPTSDANAQENDTGGREDGGVADDDGPSGDDDRSSSEDD